MTSALLNAAITGAAIGEWAFAPFAFVLAVVVLLTLAPFIVLWVVADSRGHSRAFILFGFFNWLGVLIGVVLMLMTDPGGQTRAALSCGNCGAGLGNAVRYCTHCGMQLR